MSNIWVYDLETYKYFFSATFKNIETNEEKVFYAHSSRNNIKDLYDFLITGYQEPDRFFVGYNNKYFDDLILSHFLISIFNFPTIDNLIQSMHEIGDSIIKNQKSFNTNEYQKLLKKNTLPFHSIDILQYYESRERKSLKQSAINIGWDWIQDLPLGVKEFINEDQIDLILAYNLNDVLITAELLKLFKDRIALSFGINDTYQVNVINANKSKTADILLGKFYSEYTGLSFWDFRNLRTHHKVIKIRDCLSNKIIFKTPELNKLLNRYRVAKVQDTHNELKDSITINGTKYNLGTGGLHSKDTANMFIATDMLYIRDADVNSFYPQLLLNEQIKPRHIKEEIWDIIRMVLYQRLEAKHNNIIVTADALKIILNSGGFGKMGSDTHWMYDRQAMVSVTINGQMFLLMLIERLNMADFKVISANTDGIVTLIEPSREEEYYAICKEWSSDLNFELEYTNYTHYIRRDVNNYVTKTITGKFKEKGIFKRETDVVKGFNTKIIAFALHEYYFNNIPISETIRKHNNIKDFCLSEKSGEDFKTLYRYIDSNGEYQSEYQQKNLRFYVSNNGGTLIKLHNDGRGVRLCSGESVIIYNKHIEQPMCKYNVNYRYYIEECNKAINTIKYNTISKKVIAENFNQLKLF